jgi:N-acetylmuramic acid 6-phosphate (MurNAc-6-P) etherase
MNGAPCENPEQAQDDGSLASRKRSGGLAQKMVLHSLSTTVMVRLGLVDGNLMRNLATTSDKLRQRALRIVMALSRCDGRRAVELLAECDGNVSEAFHRWSATAPRRDRSCA